MREIQWCAIHDTAMVHRSKRCGLWFALNEDAKLRSDACEPVPMLLVPKDAPSIVVPDEWWHHDVYAAWREVPWQKPAGRYVLVDEEER